jgi:mannose-1-phosphate guanylyltransferase
VTAFVEKPAAGEAPADTINAGTYVVDPRVLDLIPAGRAVSVEYEVFPLLVGAGLYAWSFDGAWRDIGTPESYLDANLEQMPPGGLIDPSAEIAPGARVMDSVVGAGCRVEAGARVLGSVLLAGAVVAGGRTVQNRVVAQTGEPVW